MSEYTFFISFLLKLEDSARMTVPLVLRQSETDLRILLDHSMAEGELAVDLGDAVVNMAAEAVDLLLRVLLEEKWRERLEAQRARDRQTDPEPRTAGAIFPRSQAGEARFRGRSCWIVSLAGRRHRLWVRRRGADRSTGFVLKGSGPVESSVTA